MSSKLVINLKCRKLLPSALVVCFVIFQLEDLTLDQGTRTTGQENYVGRRRRGEEVERQLRKEQW